MKKLVSILTAAFLAGSLTACSAGSAGAAAATTAGTAQAAAATQTTSVPQSQSGGQNEDPSTITITALDAGEEETQVEVPYNPQRLAVMDLAALDILDNLGLGDRVVGVSTTTIDYLASYETGDRTNLGNIKQADLEAVMSCEPDVIFIGGRLASSYNELSKIAPVVLLTTDSSLGVVESTEKNAKTIASIFGMEDKIDTLMADYSARIEKLQAAAQGRSAVIGMVTSGSFNVIGNNGRLSLIVKEIGFSNAGAEYADSQSSGASGSGHSGRSGSGNSGSAPQSEASGTASAEGSHAEANPHGSESSFELLTQLNPDYIFVLDRDSAIGTDGAKLAADVMDNDIVNATDAAKNGHIIVLEHPGVWYTAEGGITALGVMISDLETALLN